MEIKVYPLIVPKQNNKKISKDTVTPRNNNNQNSLSGVYYSPINFRGGGVDNLLLINDLEKLHGIHCPACNVVMLTDEEFNNITDRAKDIKSAEEFVSFLEENQENVLPQYKNLVRHSRELLVQEPNSSLLDLQKKLSAGSTTRLSKTLGATLHEVSALQEIVDFSQNDKELIKKYEEEGEKLKEVCKYGRFLKEYKNLLSNSLYLLENKNKKEINNYVYTKVKKAYDYRQLFSYDFSRENSELTGTQQFIKNLLSKSVSRVTDVNPGKTYAKDSAFNKVLECKDCRDNHKNLYSLTKSGENIKEYTNNYVEDLGKAILNKKLTINSDYVFMINSRIKSLYRENDNKRLPKTLFKAKNMIYQQKRSEMGFSLVDYEGIPCAGCGKITLTHNQVQKIHDEILNAKDMNELSVLMHEYMEKDLVRPRFKPVVKLFRKLLHEKNINSEDEMYNKLKDFTWKSLSEQINNNANIAKKYLKTHDLSPDDNSLIVKYVNALTKNYTHFNKSEPFPYEEFSNLLKETLTQLKTYKKDEILYEHKSSIRDKYVPQLPIYRGNDIDDVMKSKLRFALFQIVKNSVATMDHVIARDNDGQDNKNNLIVLCKDCNKEKSNTSFTYWIKHKKNVVENMQKFIDKITELAGRGKIEGYDDYSSELINHINEAAGKDILIYNPYQN